jgi:hypothetical protein
MTSPTIPAAQLNWGELIVSEVSITKYSGLMTDMGELVSTEALIVANLCMNVCARSDGEVPGCKSQLIDRPVTWHRSSVIDPQRRAART